MILFELEREFQSQPYLKSLYQALFAIAYYGLFRIGEVAWGPHTMQARNVFIAVNKCKILIILYTSKTHGIEARPQRIKISALQECGEEKLGKNSYRHFCPFEQLLRTQRGL